MPVAASMPCCQNLPTERPRTEVQRGTYLQESPVPRAIPLYLGVPLERCRSIVSIDMAWSRLRAGAQSQEVPRMH